MFRLLPQYIAIKTMDPVLFCDSLTITTDWGRKRPLVSGLGNSSVFVVNKQKFVGLIIKTFPFPNILPKIQKVVSENDFSKVSRPLNYLHLSIGLSWIGMDNSCTIHVRPFFSLLHNFHNTRTPNGDGCCGIVVTLCPFGSVMTYEIKR